jgi:hypothetical protein
LTVVADEATQVNSIIGAPGRTVMDHHDSSFRPRKRAAGDEA